MSNNGSGIMPVFKDGKAQPVFPFTDGKTGDAYDKEATSIVRYCVYIESDYDMDGDGKCDLVKAFVQVPRSAAEGNYKAATVFEARPYCAGVNADGYDHMKQVEDDETEILDLAAMKRSGEKKVPTGSMSSLEAAAAADPASWYYEDKGTAGSHCYEDIDLYNYYLVRGFAVVESAGFGTLGSDGFVYVGSDLERDAFKAVVEWIHGDRVGYTDREGTITTAADWSNGKVGMTGRSYAGTMPFAVATTGVAGLETIVPVAGISDWYTFLNQQGAQRYWPQEMLMSFLSYYCTSRYNADLTEEQKKALDAFHHTFSMEQLKSGFDYSDFWTEGHYCRNAGSIKCSALIVHGLNDMNVSTKQFEMMHKAFEQSGQTVKAILHQGPHMTPTMANKGYGIKVDGQYYDEILNEWFSHYLYGVENGAEDMPAVLVQNNTDQTVWETADSWETGCSMNLVSGSSDSVVIDTDWDKAGINDKNFDERMNASSSNMNAIWRSAPLDGKVTVQGSVRVDFQASLEDGSAAGGFDGKNVNDADKLSCRLGTDAGIMDDVKLTVQLCDVCDEAFDSFQTTDPQRNTVPIKVAHEGAIELGSNLPALDESEFEPVHKNYCVIARAYIDMCNPDSGYEPETAAASVELKKGEAHDYHVFLDANRYTVLPGHSLQVVIGTEDPVNCLLHKEYSVRIEDASVGACIPTTEDAAEMKIERI